jgi:hypothetical protein
MCVKVKGLLGNFPLNREENDIRIIGLGVSSAREVRQRWLDADGRGSRLQE